MRFGEGRSESAHCDRWRLKCGWKDPLRRVEGPDCTRQKSELKFGISMSRRIRQARHESQLGEGEIGNRSENRDSDGQPPDISAANNCIGLQSSRHERTSEPAQPMRRRAERSGHVAAKGDRGG